MAIHLTRVYTKTGDGGETRLGDGSKTPKTDPRLAAFADCDEANAAIGVALALGRLPDDVARCLAGIQNDLFDVGADLCTPVAADEQSGDRLRITDADVERLEAAIDDFNARLDKLDSFVLPAGTPGAALLHSARTVVRRAERATWTAAAGTSLNPLTARYLNRLSDLLFVLARTANTTAAGGPGDVLWRPAASR